MPVDLDRDTQKEAIKEAITEWLDAQFSKFGKWTMSGIVSALIAFLAWSYLTSNGWVAK